VLKALGNEATGWGERQLEQLSFKSPTSLAVTFRQLQEGAALEFDQAMRLEYRLVPRFLAGHDFREGIRALIIDKDGRPEWRPRRLEDVSAAQVDAYFQPLLGGDLQFNRSCAAG
jgi:enoyl-CoA hydratase